MAEGLEVCETAEFALYFERPRPTECSPRFFKPQQIIVVEPLTFFVSHCATPFDVNDFPLKESSYIVATKT